MIRFARTLLSVTALLETLAAGAGDMNKVLHWEFRAAETGFDPGRVTDYYSNTVIEAVFERLLTYDYLARPSRLVPEAAEARPQISDTRRTDLFSNTRGACVD